MIRHEGVIDTTAFFLPISPPPGKVTIPQGKTVISSEVIFFVVIFSTKEESDFWMLRRVK